MPRQRPKGSASQPIGSALPLTISASPTNIPKKSQSPVTTNDSTAFTPNVAFQSFPPVQPTFQTSPSYQHGTQMQVTTASAFHTTQTFFPPNSSQEHPDANLDNLFQSSVYPDPFRDDSALPKNASNSKIDSDTQQLKIASSINNLQKAEACILPEVKHISTMSYIQSDAISPTSKTDIPILPGPVNLTGNGHSKSKTGLNKMESSSQCKVAETPPASPTLTIPKGHRRNMSDTTAFNK